VPYTPLSVHNFDRIKKKLPPALRTEIDGQVRAMCDNPVIGEEKTGDLRGVRVHKFHLSGQLYLLAYWPDATEKTITLLALGGHENFYRDLKRYLAG
jgi:mRNA-degrading endonuclease RelE of RelBE toxin-antitoxin system